MLLHCYKAPTRESGNQTWQPASGNKMHASGRTTYFTYWAKMSLWTIEQATALLIGEDPDAVIGASGLSASCSTETRERYQSIFRLLDSHTRASGIGYNQPPTEIIEWALHAKVEPPQALVDAVRAQGRSLIEKRAQAASEEKPLAERERNTLLRIIIGMAIGGYSYDPDAKRSETPKEIADDLSELGLECSDQTIREKLKEARALLPGDWKPRNADKPN